jgi:hypothetical protein
VINKACNASRAAAILSYNNKAELDAAVDNHTSFCLVIQFNDELSGAKDNNNLPSNLDITIRYNYHISVIFKYTWNDTF